MNATLLFDGTGHEVRRKEFLVHRMYAHCTMYGTRMAVLCTCIVCTDKLGFPFFDFFIQKWHLIIGQISTNNLNKATHLQMKIYKNYYDLVLIQ